MKEDIMQVQEIVKQLASPGEDEDGSGFHTFLLAPFKDPGILLSYIYNINLECFLKALECKMFIRIGVLGYFTPRHLTQRHFTRDTLPRDT